MADLFSFKKGARLPSRTITLVGNGLTTLTGIDNAKFIYRKSGVVERTEILAVVVDVDLLQIRVDFAALDVDEISKYQWHVEVTIGGLVMCFPEKGFYTFSVTETIEV